MKPRRGISIARVPGYVNRMLVIRTGEIIERTEQRNKYGNLLFRTCNGKKNGMLCSWSMLTHVKPIYTYAQGIKLIEDDRYANS